MSSLDTQYSQDVLEALKAYFANQPAQRTGPAGPTGRDLLLAAQTEQPPQAQRQMTPASVLSPNVDALSGLPSLGTLRTPQPVPGPGVGTAPAPPAATGAQPGAPAPAPQGDNMQQILAYLRSTSDPALARQGQAADLPSGAVFGPQQEANRVMGAVHDRNIRRGDILAAHDLERTLTMRGAFDKRRDEEAAAVRARPYVPPPLLPEEKAFNTALADRSLTRRAERATAMLGQLTTPQQTPKQAFAQVSANQGKPPLFDEAGAVRTMTGSGGLGPMLNAGFGLEEAGNVMADIMQSPQGQVENQFGTPGYINTWRALKARKQLYPNG